MRKRFSTKSRRIFSRRRVLSIQLRTGLTIVILALIGGAVFFLHSYRTYAKLVDARLARGYLTSRGGIYAAPRVLRRAQRLSSVELAAALRRAGYLESEEASEVWNGSFAVRADNSIEIRPNLASGFPSVVRICFDKDGRISDLSGDDITLDSFELAPESLTADPAMKGGSHTQLAFKDIPFVLVQAITSIEDRRFFDHHGLDPFGVIRALLRNAGDERLGQGGSTITQQLVKNTYLTPERTLRRKFAEAMLAFTLERRLSKEDIFALYCNEIYLGQRGAFAVRGIDQAAQVYFGKQPKELSLAEAATLAGMIQGPSRYSPIRHNEAARARRNTVLGTMVRDGFITLGVATTASKEPLAVAPFDPARESVAPYFIDYVNRETSTSDNDHAPAENSSAPSAAPFNEASAIVTTLDLDLQRLATQAISKQLARLDEIYKARGQTPEAALVALDPHTGNILAMSGGRDYAESQLDRVTDARRQPGSVFKPFVYAAALESGMSPLTMFKDAPQQFTYDRKFKYRPSNYGGGFSMRELPMRDGLIKSLNVVTVEVAIRTGLARVANTAQQFGLPRPDLYPALALGTTEVTPLQLAAAYAAFANGGRAIQPNFVSGSRAEPGPEIIQATTAYVVTDMLEGVIDHGTAHAARGAVKGSAIAGKTGTSRDGWFVGYTPNLVCAVWVGFDDNKQLGLTGAEAALPVWTDFMKNAIDLRPELGEKSFAKPDGITIVEVDPESDALATGKCPLHERVAILTEQAPTSECFLHNLYFDPGPDLAVAETPRTVIARAPPMIEARRNRSYESPLLRDTRVDIDRSGRKTLVNDMRVAGR